MVFFCLFQLNKALAAFRSYSVLQFPLISRPQFSNFVPQIFIPPPPRMHQFTLFRCVTLHQRANNGKREKNNCCWLLNAPTHVQHTPACARTDHAGWVEWRDLSVAFHKPGWKNGLWKEVSKLHRPDNGHRERHRTIKWPGRCCLYLFPFQRFKLKLVLIYDDK